MENTRVRAVLKMVRKADTEGYVNIRIGIPGAQNNGKKTTEYKYTSLGYKVPARSWNEAKQCMRPEHPQASEINAHILREKSRITDDLSSHKVAGGVTVAAVDKTLRGSMAIGSFIRFFEDYVIHLKETGKSPGYIKHWNTELTRIVAYTNGELMFNQVTREWLEDYEKAIRKNTVKPTTLNSIFKRVREIIKRCIERDNIKSAAVAGYKWPVYKQPERAYLTVEECGRIENLVYSGDLDTDSVLLKIAAYFLVECFAGIRFSDWARYSIEKLIDNDALKVRTKKTSEPVYLPLSNSPRLSRIVNFIKDRGIVFNIPEQVTNRLLKILAVKCDPAITTNLTTHVGRHTCATLLLEIGYSHEAIAEVLGVGLDKVKIYAKTTRRKLMNEYEKFGGL